MLQIKWIHGFKKPPSGVDVPVWGLPSIKVWLNRYICSNDEVKIYFLPLEEVQVPVN